MTIITLIKRVTVVTLLTIITPITLIARVTIITTEIFNFFGFRNGRGLKPRPSLHLGGGGFGPFWLWAEEPRV